MEQKHSRKTQEGNFFFAARPLSENLNTPLSRDTCIDQEIEMQKREGEVEMENLNTSLDSLDQLRVESLQVTDISRDARLGIY